MTINHNVLRAEVRDAILSNKGWDELPEAKQNELLAQLTPAECFEAYCYMA